MYTYITGYYKTLDNKVDWVEIDDRVRSESVESLYGKYAAVKLVLKAPSLPKMQLINITDLPADARSYKGNIIEYLNDNGNNTLLTVTYIEDREPGVVRYLNFDVYGYKSTIANINYHKDAPINRDEKTEILLSHDDLSYSDYKDIESKSVAICNGLLHRTAATKDGIYLIGAGLTSRYGNDNSVGILDFSEIGIVDKIAITEKNIVEYNPGGSLRNEAYLKIPTKYAGKATMLSIGGYLLTLGTTLSYVTDTVLKIDVRRLALDKRYLESIEYGFNVNSLKTTRYETGDDVRLDELYTDEVLTRLFTHTNSFFIFIDANYYHAEKRILENPRYPGKYLSKHLPIYPVIGELGILTNYIRYHIDDTYVLHTNLKLRDNSIYNKGDFRDANRISYTRRSDKPLYYQNAYELRIRFARE